MYPDISPHTRLFPASQERAPHGKLRRLFGAMMRNWQKRKLIATFEAMDDRTLKDIGLYRQDIVRVVNSFDEMRAPSGADTDAGARPRRAA